MSDTTLDTKAAWITRVLGVRFDAVGSGRTAGDQPDPFDWAAVRAAFDAAVEQVDRQIAALQAALRNSDDDVLEEIAEFGMNGLTGNHRVKLMAAMMGLDRANAATIRTVAPAVIKLVLDFKAHLDSDERVEVCDENPFGVAVSIRATLGGALATMADQLRKA